MMVPARNAEEEAAQAPLLLHKQDVTRQFRVSMPGGLRKNVMRKLFDKITLKLIVDFYKSNSIPSFSAICFISSSVFSFTGI